MATMEMTIEEELEEIFSIEDGLAFAPRELATPTQEPWKDGSNPEAVTDADWLFEILMA